MKVFIKITPKKRVKENQTNIICRRLLESMGIRYEKISNLRRLKSMKILDPYKRQNSFAYILYNFTHALAIILCSILFMITETKSIIYNIVSS